MPTSCNALSWALNVRNEAKKIYLSSYWPKLFIASSPKLKRLLKISFYYQIQSKSLDIWSGVSVSVYTKNLNICCTFVVNAIQYWYIVPKAQPDTNL